METNISQSFAGGYKTGVDMGKYQQQSDAETSLLSSRAEQAKIQTEEMKQTYSARMGAMSTEQQIAKANNNIDSASNQGRMDMLQRALQDPSTRDNPRQSEYIREQMKETSADMASLAKDKASINEAEQTQHFDAVNNALVTNTPEAWDSAITNAPDSKTKDILTQVKTVHQSPEYQQSSPEEKRTLDSYILSKIAPAKAAATMMNNLQKNNLLELERMRKEDRDAELAREASQKAALSKEKIDTSTQTKAKDKADTTEKTISRKTETHDKAIERLQEKLSNITNTLPETEKEVPGKFYGTNKVKVENPEIKTIRTEIETRERDYDVSVAKLRGKTIQSLPKGQKLPIGRHTDGEGNTIRVLENGKYIEVE